LHLIETSCVSLFEDLDVFSVLLEVPVIDMLLFLERADPGFQVLVAAGATLRYKRVLFQGS